MTLNEAAKIASVSQSTATRWIQAGIIRPRGHVGKQGHAVPIGRKELRELCVLAQLRDSLSFQQLRKAAEFLRGLGHNPFSTGTFAVLQGRPGRRRLVKITDQGEAIELLGKQRGQLLLVSLVEPEQVTGT